jgi:hypothetical protein
MAVLVGLALKPNALGNSPFMATEPFAQRPRIYKSSAVSGDVLQSLF